jgi:hypothetical protein
VIELGSRSCPSLKKLLLFASLLIFVNVLDPHILGSIINAEPFHEAINLTKLWRGIIPVEELCSILKHSTLWLWVTLKALISPRCETVARCHVFRVVNSWRQGERIPMRALEVYGVATPNKPIQLGPLFFLRVS